MSYPIKLSKNLLVFPILIAAILLLSSLFLNSVLVESINLESPFSEPSEILVNSEKNRIFILNRQSNEITIFDGKEKKALTNIPIDGQGPIAIAQDKEENIYVLNQLSSNIAVFSNLINQITPEKEFISLEELKSPTDFYINDDLQKIYTLNARDNTLSIIDKKTKKVITNLRLGKTPNRVLANQKLNKLYILNSGDGKISVIDEKENKLIKHFSVGVFPSDLAISLDNKVFVSSFGDNSIYVIDSLTDEIIKTIKNIGQFPQWLSLNWQTKKLYISNFGDSSLSVIDTENYNLIKKIPLPTGSFGYRSSINPNTNQIFVPNRGTKTVLVIDGKEDKIIATLETGIKPGKPAINLKTNEVYIPNILSDSITIISETPEGQFQSQTIPDQKGIVSTGKNFSYPFNLALNENTNEIYVLNNLAGNFVVVNGKTYEIKDKISVGVNPRKIIFSPELNKIFVASSDKNNITIYNLQDSSKKTIGVGDKPFNLILNSQTKKLYVLNYASQDVSVIDTEKESRLTDISIGGIFLATALNSKENKIYVADLSNDEIIIIDGQTNQILNRIKVKPKPSDRLLFDETSNRLYLANSMSNSLTIIDGITNQIVKTLEVGERPGYLASNKERIYLSISGERTIEVIDSDSMEIISSIQTSWNPRKSVVDKKNQKLFVLTPWGILDIIDLKENTLIRSLNIYNSAVSLANLIDIELKDMVLNSKTDKLFIALGGADAIAVVNAKNNRLETLITDEEVIKIIPPYIYLIGAIILILIILAAIIIWRWRLKAKKAPLIKP